MQDLGGAVGVITGGGDGIGRAGALRLAEQGMDLAILDIREDAALETAAACARLGVRAIAAPCDVTDAASLDDAAARVQAELGSVRFVWANAGVVVRGGTATGQTNDLRWLFSVNVDGSINTVRAFAPGLLAQTGWRHVALTNSGGGLMMLSGPTAYCASKFAQLGVAEAVREDFAGTGVGVSAICPGAVNTRIWDGCRARPDRFGGASIIPPTGSEALENEARRNTVMDADRAAVAMVEGVRRGDFYIMVLETPDTYRQKIRERADEMIRAIDAAEAAASRP